MYSVHLIPIMQLLLIHYNNNAALTTISVLPLLIHSVCVALTNVGDSTAEQLVRHGAVGKALHRLTVAVLQDAF